jgi:hypothetical protein
MTLVPGCEDLLVTGAFKDEKSGLLQNRILRLRSEPGGKRARTVETILALDEFTSPSNQIQQVVIGPDHTLYVSVGDADNFVFSLDRGRFAGKILRLNLDGSACADNPFFDASNPDSPRGFVYALGVRNIFDFDFDAAGRCFAVDNGKNIDRFFQIVAGGYYGWNGNPDSIRVNAQYTWGPENNPAPVGLEILDRDTLGRDSRGRCYVALFGPPAEIGPNHGKGITEFRLDASRGLLNGLPEMLVQYRGDTKATVLGLAEGPDGLYFTDFWGETTGSDDAQGRIYKIVPSTETLGLPDVSHGQIASLSPLERGRAYFHRECASCHTVDGVGGREGPDLSHAIGNIDRRLNSVAYRADLEKLIVSGSRFAAEQKPRLTEVLDAKGNERIRIWLRNHVEEPRFDNPSARMPGFAKSLPETVKNDIIGYLMTRR